MHYKQNILFILFISLMTLMACSAPASTPTVTAIPATSDPTTPPEPSPTVTSADVSTTGVSIVDTDVAAQATSGVTLNTGWNPYTETINGVEMVLVPAGCFMMGITDDQLAYSEELGEQDFGEGARYQGWFDNEQPSHEVCFATPFWLDTYEVSNIQFDNFNGTANNESSTKAPDEPRVSISWAEASAFCESRGGRLPTEAEWEYAARGPENWLFVWGNEFDVTNVVNPNNPSTPPIVAPTGTQSMDVSWVGAYDLSGNVNEWVNDWYDPDYYGNRTNEIEGPETGEDKVKRGGAYNALGYFFRATTRLYSAPDSTRFDSGFRCMIEVQP